MHDDSPTSMVDVLTLGDLRRATAHLSDDIPLVSWETSLTGRIDYVLSMGVIDTWRHNTDQGPFLFIGQGSCTTNLEEVEFTDELWPRPDRDATDEG